MGTRQEVECVQGAKQVQLLEGWEDNDAKVDWLRLCVLCRARVWEDMVSRCSQLVHTHRLGTFAGEGIRNVLTGLSHVSEMPTTGFPDRKKLERLGGRRSQPSGQDESHDAVPSSKITLLLLLMSHLLLDAFRGRIAFCLLIHRRRCQAASALWIGLRDRIST